MVAVAGGAGRMETPVARPVATARLGPLEVRLEGAPAGIVRQLERELGIVASPPEAGAVQAATATTGAAASLVLRFPRHLELAGPLTLLGLSDGGFAFDGERFYLLDEERRLIALDLHGYPDAGSSTTSPAVRDSPPPEHRPVASIIAQPGVGRIPHLAALAGLLLLASGRVLLHAASLTLDGRGILVPGWQSAGKSELLLGFMAGGRASYAGDEWTVVGPDRTMEGLASYPHLWAWQLRQLPALAAVLPPGERRRMRVLAAARGLLGPATRLGPAGLLGRSANALDALVANAERVRLAPDAAFGKALVRGQIQIDDVLLPVVGPEPGVRVRPVDQLDVAARMVASQAWERRGLEAAHAQLRYAFPGRRWPLLEGAADVERRLLEAALAGVPAHEVRHPYPADLRELARVASGALARGG